MRDQLPGQIVSPPIVPLQARWLERLACARDPALVREQVVAAHGRALVSIVIQFVLTIFCAVLLLAIAPLEELLTWISAMGCLALVRLGYRARIIRLDLISRNPSHVLRFYLIGASAAGFVLGLCAIWLKAPEQSQTSSLVIMMCGSICAFSIAACAGTASLSIMFSLCLFAPFTTKMLMIGSPGALLAFLGIALTFGYVVIVSRQTERLFIASFRSRQESEMLVQSIGRINAELETANRGLQYQATHDALSGLFNRGAFHDHLSMCCIPPRQSDTMLTMILLDLDRFKAVNDRFGHASGDHLIQQVSARLTAAIAGQNALVARLGGDEFGIIYPSVPDHAAIEEHCDRIIHALTRPYTVKTKQTITIGASLGAISFPSGTGDPDVLMKTVDNALYRAKRQGGDRFEIASTPEWAI